MKQFCNNQWRPRTRKWEGTLHTLLWRIFKTAQWWSKIVYICWLNLNHQPVARKWKVGGCRGGLHCLSKWYLEKIIPHVNNKTLTPLCHQVTRIEKKRRKCSSRTDSTIQKRLGHYFPYMVVILCVDSDALSIRSNAAGIGKWGRYSSWYRLRTLLHLFDICYPWLLCFWDCFGIAQFDTYAVTVDWDGRSRLLTGFSKGKLAEGSMKYPNRIFGARCECEKSMRGRICHEGATVLNEVDSSLMIFFHPTAVDICLLHKAFPVFTSVRSERSFAAKWLLAPCHSLMGK